MPIRPRPTRLAAAVTLAALLTATAVSCERRGGDPLTGPLPLRFSTDTVMFDTVFTGIGTITRRFTAHNTGKSDLRLDRVWLGRGGQSPFSINVDGAHGPAVEGVEIARGDSAYIFVEANIDPGRDQMVEIDSVRFQAGGAQSDVKLVAFGQDVNLVVSAELGTQTWTAEKPYLVYGYADIAPGQTLTIEAGARVHFHHGASLLVEGTLQAQGRADAPVLFRSDRLEPFYSDKPGQWGAWLTLDDGSTYMLGGIHFTTTSTANVIDHAIIENTTKAIQLDSVWSAAGPGLRLTNTIIRHANLAGVVAQTSSLEAHNLVVNNCGQYALALTLGGDYWINHSTIANYTPYSLRKEPAVLITNFYSAGGTNYVYDLRRCLFTNSVIHGSESASYNELGLSLHPAGETNYLFDHCILQVDASVDTTDTAHFRHVRSARKGMKYKDVEKYDFDLDTLSPAKDFGLREHAAHAPADILGRGRLADTLPDAGAYERQE